MNNELIPQIHELYTELANLIISAYIYGHDINTESRVLNAQIESLLNRLVPSND